MEDRGDANSERSWDDSFSRATKVRRLDDQESEPEPEPESDSSGSLSPSLSFESFKKMADRYHEIAVEQGLSPLSLSDEDYRRGMEEEVSTQGGSRMMEVFSVQFVDYEKVKPEEMYGLLQLYCGSIHFVLFERFPGDPLPIDSKGFVKFTDQSTIDAYDRVEFVGYPNELKGHAYKLYGNLWNGVSQTCLVFCNKLLSKRFNTQFGTVQVNFAVFTRSVPAVLEVKLLDWKDKGKHSTSGLDTREIEVFGEVTARTNLITYDRDRAKSFMFKREKEMCALVRPGDALPLSRGCTVLPVGSSVVLDVHLCYPSDNDSGSGSTSGADDLIVNGRLEVPITQEDGEFVEFLKGDSAIVQLKIALGYGALRVMPKYGGVPFASSLSSTFEERCKPTERMKRRLAEVFFVRFCEEVMIANRHAIYGFALLESPGDDRNAVLFRRKSQDLDPQLLQKTGVVKLIGPMHGVEVKDELLIHAYLWAFSFPPFNSKCAHTLWTAGIDETDEFICKEVETNFGRLEVTFAVYSESLEAHMEVSLVDWNAPDGVEAFGTVNARNSKIPGGWGASTLFERLSDEAVSVKPGKDATVLPLSRSVTVVPRESTLLVHVMISRQENSGVDQQEMFQKLSFDARLTGTQTKVACGEFGNVQVTVTFGQ